MLPASQPHRLISLSIFFASLPLCVMYLLFDRPNYIAFQQFFPPFRLLQPMTTPSAYDQLIAESKEIALLGSTASVLGWDEQTYMPAGAAPLRADQFSLIARLAHERHTGQRFADLLAGAEAEHSSVSPESDIAINLHHFRRDFDR